MARSFIIVLGTLVLVALASACSSGSSGGGGGSNIPRSNSGRPFGIDISDNAEVYPNYDRRHSAVGVGLEVRPNSQTDVRLTGGVGVRDALNGNFRPQGDLELEHRLNDRVQWNVGAGVDPNGQPRGHIGVGIRFRRRRSAETASLDEETSRILFQVFDLNRDEKVDVDDWSKEGGKILSFAGMIETYDKDGDEKMSLQEFLQVPLLPNLGLDLDQVGLVLEPTLEPEQE